MRILLEGPPRVGKSTVARGVVSLLQLRGVPLAGFLTEEVREGGHRVGFAIETVDGRRGLLAHVDLAGPPRVGRYGVDLEVVERLAVPSLRAEADVTVVDELGDMELACAAFREGIELLFDVLSRKVVATVHVHPDPLTDALKRRPDVELLQVTAANRDELPLHVERLLEDAGALRGKT